MQNIVTQRFLKCLEQLKAEHRISSYRQFALNLDYRSQNLNDIRKGRRDAPMELVRQAILSYSFNPVFLFTGEGPYFSQLQGGKAFDVLTIVADDRNIERIVHVPVYAQAGYTSSYSDPTYIQELPTYSLPDMRYRSGSYRSFDVNGSSMLPSIHPFDRLICRYIEPQYWGKSIKNNHVYVIVTSTDVVVKRVENKLESAALIRAISDNVFFEPYDILGVDIREVWHVETVMRQFDHFPQSTASQSFVPANERPLPSVQETVKKKSAAERTTDLVIDPDDFAELMDGL